MTMNPTDLPPTAISFPTQIENHYKTPSIYPIPTIQVRKYVTHIDSNGTRVPVITTKATICIISGDPIYLIEGTPNQTYQANIDSLCQMFNGGER